MAMIVIAPGGGCPPRAIRFENMTSSLIMHCCDNYNRFTPAIISLLTIKRSCLFDFGCGVVGSIAPPPYVRYRTGLSQLATRNQNNIVSFVIH